MIVIYHHIAIPYGGLGSWIYMLHPPASSLPLVMFNVINQTYFMGSFFFLSGHFSAKSLRGKSTSAFLKSKWMKLGVPAVAHTIIAGPIQLVLVNAYMGGRLGFKIFTDYWMSLRGLRGPVWYCALTLIFDAVYSALPTLPNISSLGFFPIFVLNIVASYVIRLWYPVGTTIQLLNFQPAFLPQYICCYALGASLQRPTPPFTQNARNVLIASSLVSTASIIGLMFYNAAPFQEQIPSMFGGPNLLALSYAIWNETTGYLIGNWILKLFTASKWLNRRWGIVDDSYAAFLVHPVACVAMQVWWNEWHNEWPGGVVV